MQTTSTARAPDILLALACLSYAGGGEASGAAISVGNSTLKAAATGDFELRPYMRAAFACLQRRDTGHFLFHGCIDWHSAVHAHWAVLRYANRHGAGAESAAVVERLRSPTMAREREFMNASLGFEMPYGRAWFLALALEYARLTDDDRLTPMANDIAASLRAFLDARSIDPLRRSYGNHGWALAQLLRYYRARGDVDGLDWVKRKINAHYLEFDPGASLAVDRDRPDFFSLWGNWALLLGLHDPDSLRNWLDRQKIEDAALRPITRANSAHQLGMNPSRAWGLWWAFAASGESRFEQAFAAHLRQIEVTRLEVGGDYLAYGHWVPQFVIHAATQHDGENP